MATGCPLLAEVDLSLTVPGLHYVGTHFANLKRCVAVKAYADDAPASERFPSIERMQTLYPAVKWAYE